MMLMGSFSLMHWVVVILFALIYGAPVFMIIRKAGFSGWWVLLTLVPLANLILLWVFAFVRWPVQDGRA
jgi:hypothetical protein